MFSLVLIRIGKKSLRNLKCLQNAHADSMCQNQQHYISARQHKHLLIYLDNLVVFIDRPSNNKIQYNTIQYNTIQYNTKSIYCHWLHFGNNRHINNIL